MKMKFAGFFLALIFFINFSQQINCEIIEIKDIGCQNWTEFLQDQSMMEVTKPILYRFLKQTNREYFIYLGNEPLTVWLDLNEETRFPMAAKTHGPLHGNIANSFVQIHGSPDCQKNISVDETGHQFTFRLDNLDCFTSCPRYQGKYTPFTMWSEGGPVQISGMISMEDDKQFKFYLPENQMNDFTAAGPCEQTYWLKTTFPTSDYTHLKSEQNEVFKNENGISSVHLNNNGDTVVWVEAKDSAPEHYVVIQLEDESQILEDDVVIGLEANGVEPVSFDLEKKFTKIPNGVKIYLKKVICRFNYNFLGHIRYIFNVNSTTKFTATFYDVNGINLGLKYLEEEKDGIPKPYSEPYKFEYFTIVPEPPTTTTSSTSTSTTTTTSTIVYVPNEKEETSAAPILPAPDASTKEEAEEAGMSMGMLIGIVVGGLIGLLLLICIIVICGLRCYRSQKRKEQNANFETETQAEEAIRKQRSIWGNLIIFLIGPAPMKEQQHKQKPAPAPQSYIQLETSQHASSAYSPVVPIMIQKSKSEILKAPEGSKMENVSKKSTFAPTPAQAPDSEADVDPRSGFP